MDDKEQVIGILTDKLRSLVEERQITFALLEETQQILEIASSEIPIHSEMRQQVEHAVNNIRSALSAYCASLQVPPPTTPPKAS